MPLRDRIDDIRRMRVEEGVDLQVIADRYGVSRERVRQVLAREGMGDRPQGRAARCVLCAYSSDKTILEIAEEAGVAISTARAALKRNGLTYQHRMRGPGRRYTDKELLDLLRQLGEKLGRTPTARDMIAVCPPSQMVYHKQFGSLSNAQRLAGFEPNRPGHPGHQLEPR